MDVLILSEQLRKAMLDHLLHCLPEEGCGLVGGTDGEARVVLPVTNSLHSPVRFMMEPLELLTALRYIEAQDMELVAIFHSHPNGPEGPSATDVREFSYPGTVTLIWSPDGAEWQVKGFWIEDGQVSVVELV